MNLTTKKTILKGHYFKLDLFNNTFIAPHGNTYCNDYIESLNDDEFYTLLNKEVV